jgi:CRP/FNR family transcriptional regulator
MHYTPLYFLDSLTQDEKAILENISRKKLFHKDEILFFKGEKGRYLHFLSHGIAKVYKHDAKGNEITIHTMTAPSFIAELANYEEIPYPANCRFETDAEVHLIDYEAFKTKLLIQPHVSIVFIKSLTKKIKSLESFISTHISLNSTEKIAKFILENEAHLPSLKQVQIASILNITPETLNRKLTRFKKEQMIKTINGKVEIINKERLSELANL